MGMFVKTYPVYAQLSDDKEIEIFLKELDSHIELNRENDLYAFADFCADFRLNPSVLFAYQGDMFGEMDFCGGKQKVMLMPMKDSKSGFELTVWRDNGRFTAHAEYDPSLYNDEIIRTMLESFDKILYDMLSAEKLSDIDMLTQNQREKIESNNQNGTEYEITDIVTLFRRQAEITPDNIAVVYLDKEITYRELDRVSENIAAYLKSKGIGRGDVVSVLIPRSEYMPIASLGVLKTGAGYQPLDPSYPVERLEFMVKDADAKFLIADRNLMDRLPNYGGSVLFTDEISDLPDADRLSENPAPGDLFIMLYTSGSTGVPKGVMLEHRNLCCFCEWYRSFYHLDEKSRVAAYASYGFDANMMDMYPALTSGAAGGAFLPMLPSYPDDRIDYCLTDSGSRFVITTDDIKAERSNLLSGKAYAALSVTDLYKTEDTTNPDIEIPSDSLAYCIYTSGSTGTPKGVMIEHGNLCNFVNANPLNHETVNFVSYGSVALSVAAFSFDFSLMEIHITLCNGMTLCIAGGNEIHNPLMLADMIEKYKVDVISGTPSFIANVLDIPAAAKSLKNVGMYDLGAEAFPSSLYTKLRAASPNAVIVNGYGPTEATISCISKVVDSPEHITIGTPAANVRAYIFDKCGNQLPSCAKGELIIGGLGVGRGYVNLPEKTAQAFITVNGERAYRTGDIARIDTRGEIEFFGRLDNQVKLRGLRVELDGIINVMAAYNGVKHAIVIVRGEGEQQYLCAYFTTDGTEVKKDALVEHMKQSLAHYMIPSVFVQLDEIPLTSNGKIDKKALPKPEFTQEKRTGKKPSTPLQKKLCEFFAYALGVDEVGADENFFEIGGTSLLASKVAVRAMAENLPIAFKDVFDYPTAEELEKYINTSSSAEPEAPTEEISDNSGALAHNVAIGQGHFSGAVYVACDNASPPVRSARIFSCKNARRIQQHSCRIQPERSVYHNLCSCLQPRNGRAHLLQRRS